MPRKGKEDKTEIPRTIKASEPHAGHIWKKAHDSAVKTYGEGEAAHRVAFSALKHEYKKEGGVWVKKAEKDPSDPRAAQGFREIRKHPKPTAGGKVAKTEKEARAKAKEAKREYREFRKRGSKAA